MYYVHVGILYSEASNNWKIGTGVYLSDSCFALRICNNMDIYKTLKWLLGYVIYMYEIKLGYAYVCLNFE